MRQFLPGLVIASTVLLSGAGPAGAPAAPLRLTGALDDGYYRVHSVKLQSGYEYSFAGACDRDCDDLDLELFDENWNRIDADLLRDDVPIVSVSPSWTGQFHVKVIMASCHISPCRYVIVS